MHSARTRIAMPKRRRGGGYMGKERSSVGARSRLTMSGTRAAARRGRDTSANTRRRAKAAGSRVQGVRDTNPDPDTRCKARASKRRWTREVRAWGLPWEKRDERNRRRRRQGQEGGRARRRKARKGRTGAEGIREEERSRGANVGVSSRRAMSGTRCGEEGVGAAMRGAQGYRPSPDTRRGATPKRRGLAWPWYMLQGGMRMSSVGVHGQELLLERRGLQARCAARNVVREPAFEGRTIGASICIMASSRAHHASPIEDDVQIPIERVK
ncbi:hypothetical protein B0H13DRAFT_1878359 [Mycena leptocephala]|nr:hypothetical protein B0H13DRAFT_1878359 [Mycena leptocephala]